MFCFLLTPQKLLLPAESSNVMHSETNFALLPHTADRVKKKMYYSLQILNYHVEKKHLSERDRIIRNEDNLDCHFLADEATSD